MFGFTLYRTSSVMDVHAENVIIIVLFIEVVEVELYNLEQKFKLIKKKNNKL